MSDLTTISTMFEEIKKTVKQILTNLEKSKDKPEQQSSISTSDLATIESNIASQVNQSEELILSKLEQIKQAQTTPKKLHHRISIDIASSWVFLTIIGLGLILLVSFFFHYKQRETISDLSDNDLKYRYIKAFNKADSTSVFKLEDIFEYNRDAKTIKEIRKAVEQYERNVADRARRLEQAKLKEEEAKKLHEEADKLKD